MKAFFQCLIILIVAAGCAKQPSLPSNSKYNVTASLNDSVWYGTGKVLRIKEPRQEIGQVKKFNLIVFTDIDYPGVGSGPNPKTNNGCSEPECTRTQSLVIYNVPLKKGRFKISKLDKRAKFDNEYACLSYIGNAGGLLNLYVYKGLKPGWIRVTKIDRKSGIVEGRFAISFSQDTKVNPLGLRDKMPATARFREGLFRIKITDVLIK